MTVDQELKQYYDQVLASVRDLFPDKPKEWHDAYILRVAHYVENKGDMTNAPVLP